MRIRAKTDYFHDDLLWSLFILGVEASKARPRLKRHFVGALHIVGLAGVGVGLDVGAVGQIPRNGSSVAGDALAHAEI